VGDELVFAGEACAGGFTVFVGELWPAAPRIVAGNAAQKKQKKNVAGAAFGRAERPIRHNCLHNANTRILNSSWCFLDAAHAATANRFVTVS